MFFIVLQVSEGFAVVFKVEVGHQGRVSPSSCATRDRTGSMSAGCPTPLGVGRRGRFLIPGVAAE